MLVNLQALFAGVSTDQLNLGIRKSAAGQEGEHLMSEQVRVNVLAQSRLVAVVLHDLLDPDPVTRPT
jgi:hypothetical protein